MYLWVCAGVGCMIGILFRNVFIAIGLITLVTFVLLKATQLNVQNALGSTKEKTASQNSLNS